MLRKFSAIAIVTCFLMETIAIQLAHAAEKWPLSADPGSSVPVYKVTEGTSLDGGAGPLGTPSDILRPATRTPVLMLGNGSGSTARTVWNLTDFTKIGMISARIDLSNGASALSPDGKHFVVTKKKNFTALGAEVWSVVENKKLKTLEIGSVSEEVQWAGFVSDSVLLTLHQVDMNRSSVRLTSISTEPATAAATSFSGPNHVDRHLVSLSPGARFLAAGDAAGTISVLDLKTKATPFPIPVMPDAGTLVGIAFSPDGSEIAALFQVTGSAGAAQSSLQIQAWNMADGQPTLHVKSLHLPDVADALPKSENSALPLEWLPDGSAILIGNNTLVDRNSGQIAWRLSGASSQTPRVFLGTDYLLVPQRTALNAGLEAFKLPWREIDSALNSFQSKANSLLQPGDKISLKLEVGDVRFQKADELQERLKSVLGKRLEDQNLGVADGQAVTLKVQYSETAGATLQKQDDHFPFPPHFPPPFGFPGRPGIPSRRGTQNSAEESRTGTGTAFVIHADGYLLTCAHVVGATPSVQVKIADKSYYARVIAKNVGLDFALLKIEVKGLTPIALADSSKIELGEEVRAVGYPISTVLGESLKVTRGTIAGLVKKEGNTLFQVDASINPGNSGGPLINERGEVVGINSAKLVHETIDNVGFSIPINEVKTLLKEHKVTFQTKGSSEKLTGPDLVKRVTPSVAFVISTGAGGSENAEAANRVIVTRITCRLSLVVQASMTPVWQETLIIEPGHLRVEGALSEQKAREIAFATFLERLSQVRLPYFISKDPTPAVLPVVSNWSIAGQQAVPVLEPRKSRRGLSN